MTDAARMVRVEHSHQHRVNRQVRSQVKSQVEGGRRSVSVNQVLAVKPAVALAMIGRLGMSRSAQSTAGTAIERIYDAGHVSHLIHIRPCHAQDHGKPRLRGDSGYEDAQRKLR
jgi:hypothetical protein